MRLATFQGLPEGTAAVADWLARDEFKESVPWVRVRPGSERITVVAFAYVGSLAESLLFEVATTEGRVTWRSEVPIETTDSGVLTMSFFPWYGVIELPEAEWNAIFPTAGPYLLRARRPEVPSTYVDAFCGAETSSWILVVR
jgi:hypothetical protein